MAYATYTTDALVCGTWKRNTADASFMLFTREAGMLYADARSVREERSKQRYALQDFSLVRVSLVKGKRGWKIGSVEPHRNYFSDATTKEARGSVVAVFKFMRRFLGAEEATPALFDMLAAALRTLTTEVAERAFLEKTLFVRILLSLGYVDPKLVPDWVASETALSAAYANAETAQRFDVLIEKAVAQSHL